MSYLAPELLQAFKEGKSVFVNYTHVIDIYSYGALCYDIVCNMNFTVLPRHVANIPPAIATTVPNALLEVIDACLNENPSNRPQGMEEIIAKLI